MLPRCNTWLDTPSKFCPENHLSAVTTLQSQSKFGCCSRSLQTRAASGPTQPNHQTSVHSLQLDHVSVVLGSPELDTALWVWPHHGYTVGRDCLPQPAGNTHKAAQDLAGKGLLAFFHFSMLLLLSAQVWDGSLVSEHCFYVEEHWQGCYTPGWMSFWLLFFSHRQYNWDMIKWWILSLTTQFTIGAVIF